MQHCPPLDEHTIIEVTREGGLAFMPGLRVHQRFVLAELTDPRRGRLADLIRQLLPLALGPDAARSAGSGDQRYYRIRIIRHQASPPHDEDYELVIPESNAPPALEGICKDGRLAD